MSMHEATTVTFAAPRDVSVSRAPLPSLQPREVLVRTEYSAVSSGTELLVYNGEMPTDIPADAVFAEHAAPFSYPSAYGYAAVGRVVIPQRGERPGLEERVFAFREHTSAFAAPIASLLPIPEQVSSLDAVFFPMVETALALAADAAPLPGEAVAVVGQGTVGLLLAAVLRQLHPYCRIVVMDLREARLRVSLEDVGVHAALDPSAPNFRAMLQEELPDLADVAIDVSGAAAGLDTAVSVTRDHGRVVLGSWYGTKPVALTSLGGRFHRSHIHLVASQVSHIPPTLAGRWTKARRNYLAWRLLGDLRPSELLPIHLVQVADAAVAYAQLAAGEHVQVVFSYR